jgi:hypothetical protein
MECADQCLSLQEAYLQKRALCNISYEISSKCCNHEHILKQVGAFNSRFASKSVEDSARYTIGNMPFTLARYLQNQIDVKSVLKDISPVDYADQTESMHVALSVCFARALTLGRDSKSGNTILSTRTEKLSDDVDASANCLTILHDDPNLQIWMKTLHERAQQDEAIISKFIINQKESHANFSFQIKAMGYIMISSGYSSTLPEDIVAKIQGESITIGDKILAIFAREKTVRELYDKTVNQHIASYGKLGEVVPVTVTGVPIDGMPFTGPKNGHVETPFDTSRTEGEIV